RQRHLGPRLFLFFQAEDGIRAFHVTGVQTCALPIWSIATKPIRARQLGQVAAPPPLTAPERPPAGLRPPRDPRVRPRRRRRRSRSEERRVGHGGCCPWWV